MRLSHRGARWVVPLLFLCSGASGLIFETLWMRLLTTVFGATTFAVSTLLTAYMGGLALGGWLAGRWADRIPREREALWVYGALELAVAIYALFFPSMLGLVDRLHAWIWQVWQPGPYAFALIRFLVVGALLMPPTTAMGATLPVLGRFYAPRPGGVGRDVGTLYSVNVLGAVGGTFLAGFVLMPRWGLSVTNGVACSVNVLLFAAALALGLALRAREPAAAEPEAPESARGPLETAPTDAQTVAPGAAEGAVGGLSPERARVLALVAIGVSGVLSMSYQQVWTRVLALVVGSSVYAFALILMAFLLGLALGGAFYARLGAHRPGQLDKLGWINVAVAALAAVGLLYLDILPSVFYRWATAGALTPWAVFLVKFGLCALLVLLPTCFIGMVFPATLAVAAEVDRGVGKTVGTVYAVNTLGSILGSFLGGFALLPLVGAQRALGLLVGGNLLLALSYFAGGAHGRAARMRRVASVGVVGVIAAVAVQVRWNPDRLTAGVFRVSLYAGGEAHQTACGRRDDPVERFFRQGPGRETRAFAAERVGFAPRLDPQCPTDGRRRLLHFREGVVATVSTWQSTHRGFGSRLCWEHLALQVNGKTDASATGAFVRPPEGKCRDALGHPERIQVTQVAHMGDMETEILSGVIGVLVHRRADAVRRAMVIGWGSGISVGALSRLSQVQVDAVELEPEVVRAARPFARYAWQAERAPNVRILLADGRNVLLATRTGYDLVVSEPSNPWMAGASNLFTRDFFRRVRARLRPNGIFVQWLQTYEIAYENVLVILSSVRSVFPYVRVFEPHPAVADLLVIASASPIPLSAPQLRRRMVLPGMQEVLHRGGVQTLGDLLARFVLAPRDVTRLTRGVPWNTDDNARIEFATPLDMIRARPEWPAQILTRLRKGTLPPSEHLQQPTDADRLEVVDAYLRLGRLGFARALLSRVRPGPPARLRKDILTWLSRTPPGYPADGARPSAPGEALLARIRDLGRRARTAHELLRLGTWLAQAGRFRLALLFLAAGAREGPLPKPTARVYVEVLRRLGRWRAAFDVARRALAPAGAPRPSRPKAPRPPARSPAQ